MVPAMPAETVVTSACHKRLHLNLLISNVFDTRGSFRLFRRVPCETDEPRDILGYPVDIPECMSHNLD
jgi:hypothetical protein